ncbi:MAG: phosphatase PAP2 family protein [Flavobacteriales bacterium]|nr:MAG: phosphatase PAP2 family protein [Flavobacteriales bacterium]|tara:strand:+ start:1572 stop:2135 length:564 start_codon:yes stop_codon:yes gene_type:complete
MTLEDIDIQILVYLNSLGSEFWDPIWITLTNKTTYIPLFAFIVYYIYKRFGLKQTAFIIVFISILILFTDQFTNFIKDSFQRLRPCREGYLGLREIDIYCGKYGFFSAHASNSIAVSLFVIRIMREKITSIFSIILIIWVFVFSYSRIYLGLHYPMDILCGLIFGVISSTLFYHIYLKCSTYIFDKI